jgi:hypothetical protein
MRRSLSTQRSASRFPQARARTAPGRDVASGGRARGHINCCGIQVDEWARARLLCWNPGGSRRRRRLSPPVLLARVTWERRLAMGSAKHSTATGHSLLLHVRAGAASRTVWPGSTCGEKVNDAQPGWGWCGIHRLGKRDKLTCYNEMMEAIDCLKDANFAHDKCGRYLTAMMDCYTSQVPYNLPQRVPSARHALDALRQLVAPPRVASQPRQPLLVSGQAPACCPAARAEGSSASAPRGQGPSRGADRLLGSHSAWPLSALPVGQAVQQLRPTPRMRGACSTRLAHGGGRGEAATRGGCLSLSRGV